MANWYVGSTGNDTTGNGSYATPYLTISKAHTVASAGDTIYLIDTITMVNQTFTKSLTIQAYTNPSGATWSAVLNANSSNPVYTLATGVTLTVVGIEFKNFTDTSAVQSWMFRGDGSANNSTYTFSFTSCHFKNIAINCDANSYAAFALVYNGSNNTGVSMTVTMTNCLLDDIKRNTTATQDYVCLFASRSTGTGSALIVTMTNCIVYLPEATRPIKGIFAGSCVTETITIKNCIFSNVGGGTISWSLGGSFAVTGTATYSDFYNITSYVTGTGVITSDPLFVDASNNNFNLRPTSPCIGTGSV